MYFTLSSFSHPKPPFLPLSLLFLCHLSKFQLGVISLSLQSAENSGRADRDSGLLSKMRELLTHLEVGYTKKKREDKWSAKKHGAEPALLPIL